MTLTDFLLARIAEDEESACDAYYEGQRWAPEEESVVSLDRDLDVVMTLDRKRDAWFAADWSPTRVLAECETKRRIVETASPYLTPHGFPVLLAILAVPYADHPDYREDWKP